MKTKICTKCGIEKPLSEFYFRKDNNKYRNECKKCNNIISHNYNNKNRVKIIKNKKRYKKLFPWKIIFNKIKQRCNNPKVRNYHRYGGRGIKCLITLNEVKELWFRDKAFDLNKPSIDRINNDGDYTYDNCQFIELIDNIIKGNKETHCKPIVQFDLKGNFIKEWKSLTEASRSLNCRIDSISNCLKNKSKTSCGFIWKYKNEL